MYQPRDYQPGELGSPLLVTPLGGGTVRQLVACVKWANFAPTPRGIDYVACDPGPDPRVHLLDETGQDRVLGKLDRPGSSAGLAVSADGTAILYSRLSSYSADLMLVENFK